MNALVLRLAAIGLALLCIVISSVASAQYSSGIRYDSTRRIVGMISPDPDGPEGPLNHPAARFVYNADGQLIRIEKGVLAAWQPENIAPAGWSGFMPQLLADFAYDAVGNKIEEKNSVGATVTGITQFSYDQAGRLTCTAIRMNLASPPAVGSNACEPGTPGDDGPDRISQNVYDAAGHVVQTRRAVGLTDYEQAYSTISYTPNGKQEFLVDANGNRSQSRYDGFDRLSCLIFPAETGPTAFNGATPVTALDTAGAVNGAPSCTGPGDYERYGYDAADNRISVRRRGGDAQVIGFEYDTVDRLILKDLPGTATDDVYYSYDMQGHSKESRFGSLAGPGLSQNWDKAGRLSSTIDTSNGTARTLSYLYDAASNRKSVTHPDLKAFTYDFDPLNRLKTVKENGTTVLAEFDYDNSGRPLSEVRAGSTTTYGYDSRARLETLTHNLAGNAPVAFGFTYTASGQIHTRSISNPAYVYAGDVNVDRPYARNGLNQYISAGPADFQYDANGNLASDGSMNFLYDIENRLIDVSGARSASLKYDPLGRLRETSGGSAGITHFLYDGDELVAQYDGNGQLLRRYVHGQADDDPLVWYEGSDLVPSARRYLHPNQQGSIVAITGVDGNAIATNTYDSWGIPGALNLGAFQYTGQLLIPEIEIYYYKARFYSPTTGRFLQTDPVGYDDQINLYAYVGNDPVNARDPDGKHCTSPEKSICQVKPAPIYGTAQNTTHKKGDRHAAASQRLAERVAKVAGVERVHMNESIGTVTRGAINSTTRPDVTVVMKDGRVIPIEIASPRQTRAFFRAKYGQVAGRSGGGYTVSRPMTSMQLIVPPGAVRARMASGRGGGLLGFLNIFHIFMSAVNEQNAADEELAYCTLNPSDSRCSGPIA